MRILMLTPYVPYPPASGGQIRTYNILKQLSKHHEVHLVALYKTDEEKMAAPHLQHYCTSLHLCRRPKKPWQANTICKAITGSHPFLIVRNYSQEASQVIQKLLQAHTFDVIHAETFYVMPHIPHTSIPIFLVEQTVEYLVYQHFIESKPWFLKYPLSLDTRKLLHWEKTYWRQASLVAAVSDADATTIAKLDPTIHPIVIPNGAGDDMYVSKRSFERSRKKLFFLGNFQWLQNVEAARLLLDHIFPQALSQMPDLELVIAGQHIQRLTSTNHQSHITYVELHNEPETRVKELFLESDMFVAPIFGPGGTRLKILGAMATRTPIITTDIGAEGLSLTDMQSYIRAQTHDDFIRAISHIVTQQELSIRLTEAAYTTAQSKYSWRSITERLEKSYLTIIS